MSFNIEKRIRPNIKSCKPYSSARDEFSGEGAVYLDANENSYGSALPQIHNRYPDPLQQELKNRLAGLIGLTSSQIFLGNGSDEAIDLLIRAFCEPGRDQILTMPPTYGMYEVTASINGIGCIEVPLRDDFTPDVEKIRRSLSESVAIVFICSPNNPTGNAFSQTSLTEIIEASQRAGAIAVIDEAYIDFCPEKSFLTRLKDFQNLVVLQTFSKAWGLAEIRLGAAYASSEIVKVLNKIKPPYNVNGVTQRIAFAALSNADRKADLVQRIVSERERLRIALGEIPSVRQVFPSDANFLLVRIDDADAIYKRLIANGIIVRNRSSVPGCKNCLRITVGTTGENDFLLEILKGSHKTAPTARSILNPPYRPRTSRIHRVTKETSIEGNINLDGTGEASISTGIGFFDHMLQQLAKHGRFDIDLTCRGDLEIDEHHTIEDSAIALGEAFLAALGDKLGIERYGFLLPMDDALAQVAIDLSGRSWLEWQVEFKREKVGELPTEMVFHFFKSFCDALRCNLNVKAEGDNEHHKIEAIFKGFARALRNAVSRSAGSDDLPSTKGVL